MSHIYVFGPDENNNDYSTMGLVGALVPSECVFREEANGESIVELKHPLDEYGRYQTLINGNILVVSVPVRTTPEIQNGKCVTTVWTYKVKSLTELSSSKQRYLYKTRSSSSRMATLHKDDIVTVVWRPHPDDTEYNRWKVKSKYGTGWIYPECVELVTEHVIPDNSQAIEEVQSPWTIQPQYFRIFETKKTLSDVSVSARHISYDLLYDISKDSGSYYEITLQEALDKLFKNTIGEQNAFHPYTNVENTNSGLSWSGRNIIDCLLDPEEGLCKQFDVSIIRDNYDLYFLHDPGLNRGVVVQYGKNMTGIQCNISEDNIATRIVPVGQYEDGKILFLDEIYIDTPNANNYPIKHVYWLECENCTVGEKDENGSTITESVAKARMRKQANKLIEDECDKPELTLTVEFLNLGDSEEYKQFKNLENYFLYDYIIVRHPDLNVDVTSRIVKMEWDCLLDKMKNVEIGSIGKTMANSGITSWQVPSGISGNKISSGTIGSSAIKENAITTRHLQADSVNTDILQANCITAVKIAAGAITAEKIEAGAITADKIDAESLNAKVADLVVANLTTANIVKADIAWADIETLNATIANISDARIEIAHIKSAQIDDLNAVVAKIMHAEIKIGEFEYAEIKNLLASSLILKKGFAESMEITNLKVTSANLLNATIDKLVLKGSDGKYYQIFIGSDGTISTKIVTVTQDEIDAGETQSGQPIVDTTVDIGGLNGSDVHTSQQVIDTIFTESLTADKITAGEAMIASASIPTLYVKSIKSIGDNIDISANVSITTIVTDVTTASAEAGNASDQADSNLQEIAALNEKFDNAKKEIDVNKAATVELSTQIKQTANDVKIIKTETITGLDGRVDKLESGIHIDGSTIGIYSSDSPYRNTITNSGWEISENGSPVIVCAESKIIAPRIQITDACIIGRSAWKSGSDKHLRLLRYGK